MERGDVPAARERLLLIRDTWTAAPWPGRAALLLAKLALDGDPQAAADWALKASAELPLVGDRGLATAADASRGSGRTEQAATLFERLVREYPDSSLAPSALWSAAELWRSIEGRQSAAIAHWMDLAARFPQDPRASAALAQTVLIGAAADQWDHVGLACRKVLVEYAASADAASVSEPCARFVRSGAIPALTFEEHRRRAEMLARGAKFSDALTVWNDLKRTAPTSAIRREIDLQTAVTLYRLRRWDDAWRAFRRVAASDAAPELRAEARLWEGRASFRRDDVRALRRAESALAAAVPDSPRRLELTSLRAAWHRGQGRVDAALAAYQDLARVAGDLGRPEKVVEAYWNIGWLEYRRGQPGAAREALARGLDAAAPSDPQIPQLLYWTTRFDALSAESDPGGEGVRALTDRFPYTYYGLLARRESVGGVETALHELDGVRTLDASSDERENLLDASMSPRAAELWFLGLRDDARDELLVSTRRAPPAPDRATDVAEALATLGADQEALRVVRRHYAPALERGDAELSPAIWRRAYPAHLLGPIRTRARDRVDPFLVAALIREESVYDPRAVSPVGAIGLMQLMPDTGRRVARAAGLSDFSVDQLYTPEVNLTLGVRYLADLLDRFAGNEAYAVAAYNAGPEAVTRWLENGPPRAIEEFIEEIPYVETRAYVKRVLRSAWLYHALYGAGEAGAVSAALGAD
jgi:soluble lytic murein transglycosylase